MKGVILAGGHGTRLRPFTLKNNKALAPIYCKDGAVPQIFFPLQTLTRSGIDDILIITSRDYCGDIVEFIGDGEDFNCSVTYRIQEMDRPVTGIAQALKLAENFARDSSFAVILGDNYFEQTFEDEVRFFDDSIHDAHLFMKAVADPHRFGVGVFDGDELLCIEEKPKKPKSNLAVTGLYMYTPDVFEQLPKFKPSKRGEVEITDVNNYYIKNGIVQVSVLKEHWQDMGTPESAAEMCKRFFE